MYQKIIDSNSVEDYEIQPEELDLFKQYFPEYICSKEDKHWDVEEILKNKYLLEPETYEICAYELVPNNHDSVLVVIKMNGSKEYTKYLLDKCDLTYYTEYCIKAVEIGYQRKGANSLFYEEGMWGSHPIFDLETLKKHHERYFSYKTPKSKGGWGSFTEIDISDSEMKQEFYDNIVSNFIEGETFVVYH